jgi:hypothetical protein
MIPKMPNLNFYIPSSQEEPEEDDKPYSNLTALRVAAIVSDFQFIPFHQVFVPIQGLLWVLKTCANYIFHTLFEV